MPRYELMYILASSVSDDQVPATTDQVLQTVIDFGGKGAMQNLLGKKKLAYPIKKTRNGHYGVITFEMDANKINDLDAKIRTQDATIIRHLVVNIDEHLARLDKDREVQAKMNRNRPAERIAEDAAAASGEKPVQEKPKKVEKSVANVNLDEEIEKALTEDLTK